MIEDYDAELIEIDDNYVRMARKIQRSNVNRVYKDIFYQALYEERLAEDRRREEEDQQVKRLGLIL